MVAATRERLLETAKVLALACVCSLVTRAAFFGAGFTNVDEGAHLVGARELLLGGRLYVDFADNKPPLVYVYYAIASVFGSGVFGVRVLTAFVTWPAIALAMLWFYDFATVGRTAALAFIVASATLLPSDAHAINGEHISLLPLALSAALLRSPDSLRRPARLFFAAGLVGIASLAKQPVALCGAVYVVCVLRVRDITLLERLTSLASLAFGFAAPLALTAALFARQGTLDAFVYWVYRYNLVHIGNPMTLGDRVLQLLKMGSVLVPSVGTLAFAYARADRLDTHRRALVSGLVVATLLPAFLGWRLFGHYFVPLVFALSLGAGPFFANGMRSLGPKVCAVVLVIGFIAFTVGGRIVHDPARNLTDVSDPRYASIGAAMPPRCNVERALFVWGYAPQLYVESGLRPASRFVVPIDTITGHIVGNDTFARGALDTSSRIVPEHWDLLMSDLERSRPEYIVDTAPADLNHWSLYPLSKFPRIAAFVARDYRAHENVGGAIIYRRTDCP